MTGEFGGKRDSKIPSLYCIRRVHGTILRFGSHYNFNKEMGGLPELTTHHNRIDQWITFLYFS
jgi:hypothetical protein